MFNLFNINTLTGCIENHIGRDAILLAWVNISVQQYPLERGVASSESLQGFVNIHSTDKLKTLPVEWTVTTIRSLNKRKYARMDRLLWPLDFGVQCRNHWRSFR